MKNNNLKKAAALVLALVMLLTAFTAVNTSAAFTAGSTPPDKPGESGGSAPGGGSSSSVTSWDAVTEISENTTATNKTYTSTDTDENAIHVSGGKVVLINPTITRISSDSTGGDNSSFYGVGAAVLTTDGTTVIKEGTITTNAKGGAGVFSYGDGVTYVSGTTINTAKSTSGGIHVAGGGTLYAYNVTAETNGESSAAIRSDRGGGKMVVDGGTYTSNGTGSPAVYCTADITVNDSELNATNSEGICIEGLNSLRLFDCDLTSSMPDSSQNDTTWSVILYQSQSGDSQEGNSTYEMVGGSLTSTNGGLFYTTNTESTFYINNVDISASDDAEFFLRATGNSNSRGWGSTGSNGADCSFTADNQEMNGDVIWDSVSKLDLYMINGSVLTGAVTDDESCAGSGGSGYCSVYISSDSKWVVTGSSTVTNLYNAGAIVDGSGNTVTVKGTDGTVYVNGTSAYTITVSSYSSSADFSGCSYASSATPSFDSYAVSMISYSTEDTGDTGDTEETEETEETEKSLDTASLSVPDSGSIKYKYKAKITASASGLPSGYYVQWFDQDGNAVGDKGESSATYTTGALKGTASYTAKIVDASGNVVSSSSQEKTVKITVKDDLLSKIISFFARLFGSDVTTL